MSTLRLGWLGVAIVASGCLSSPFVNAAPSGDSVTIFVHGYKGSRLETASGEVAWVTPGQALSAEGESLARPFDGERDFPRFGPLRVNGPLTKLTIIPGILEEEGQLRFLDWGRETFPGFTAFAYDWRQDIRTSGAELCAAIASLRPTVHVRIMAHSMGALVTMQCLRQGPPEVRKRVTRVVFLGGVFGGAPAIWDDVLLGSVTLRNRTLLSAEALLTFSSSWQLLPPESDFTFDAMGKPIDAYATVPFGWGLFAEPEVKGSAAYRSQLARRLEEHHGLWHGLTGGDAGEQPWKSLAFVGVGVATQAGWKLGADGQFDLSHPMMADGDGLVVAARARPWPALHSKVVEIDAEHTRMLSDARVLALIQEFLSKP